MTYNTTQGESTDVTTPLSEVKLVIKKHGTDEQITLTRDDVIQVILLNGDKPFMQFFQTGAGHSLARDIVRPLKNLIGCSSKAPLFSAEQLEEFSRLVGEI